MALKGAIIVYAYRHEKGYTLANKILESLVDIDTLLSKWRCKYLIDYNNVSNLNLYRHIIITSMAISYYISYVIMMIKYQ